MAGSVSPLNKPAVISQAAKKTAGLKCQILRLRELFTKLKFIWLAFWGKNTVFFVEKKLFFPDIYYTLILQEARIQKSTIPDLSRSCISQWEMFLSQFEDIMVCAGFSQINPKNRVIQEKSLKKSYNLCFARFYRIFFRSDLFYYKANKAAELSLF